MAIASLVLGIVSLVFAFTGPLSIIGAIVGIIGIVLGALSRKKLKKAGQPTGMATGGLVMSIIGTILCLIFWVACIVCAGAMGAAGSMF